MFSQVTWGICSEEGLQTSTVRDPCMQHFYLSKSMAILSFPSITLTSSRKMAVSDYKNMYILFIIKHASFLNSFPCLVEVSALFLNADAGSTDRMDFSYDEIISAYVSALYEYFRPLCIFIFIYQSTDILQREVQWNIIFCIYEAV